MRDYAKATAGFWTGETGRLIRKKGRDAQVVALYLITGPSSNAIGLYYLPLPTLCHEIGISKEGASKALRSLSEAHFAYWDAPSEVVYVPNMARYQIGEEIKPKDKKSIGVFRELEKYRKCPFYKDFWKKYHEIYHLPEPSPFEAPSKPLRSQEQEQEQEQDTPLPPSGESGGWCPARKRKCKSNPSVCGELFEQFWAAYPRHEPTRAEALKSFCTIAAGPDVVRAMLDWIQRAKQSGQWQDGTKIPHATTWLNQRRWEGDPPPPATSTGPLRGSANWEKLIAEEEKRKEEDHESGRVAKAAV